MKLKLALFSLLAIFALSRCGDDGESKYTCADCSDVPDALEANDDSGKGIYKGLVIGSSGTIFLDIDNDGSGSISGTLVIDDQEIALETDDSYTTGFDGTFYGTMNTENDVEISFYVNDIGGGIEIYDITVPGHPDVTIEIIKEYSSQLIEVFEGNFSGDDSGTFNLLILRDENGDGDWYAVARSDGDTYFEGFVEGNELVGGGGEVVIVGTISGDEIGGSWESIGGGTGNWDGVRTL